MEAPIVEILSAQLRRNFFRRRIKLLLESYEVDHLFIYSIIYFSINLLGGLY